MKLYKILKAGEIIESEIKGAYAGYSKAKIFGRLDCKSGMRMRKENRVFFHTLEDAVKEGYRPCKNCRPIDEKDFRKIKYLVSHPTIEEFYNRDSAKLK
jgi:methylphosphotriester-DNA--protein-cysteine methyltransferase